jgi:hypothetical protein
VPGKLRDSAACSPASVACWPGCTRRRTPPASSYAAVPLSGSPHCWEPSGSGSLGCDPLAGPSSMGGVLAMPSGRRHRRGHRCPAWSRCHRTPASWFRRRTRARRSGRARRSPPPTARSAATCFSAPHKVPGATSNPSATSALTIRCSGRPSTNFSCASRARNPAVNRPARSAHHGYAVSSRGSRCRFERYTGQFR